MVEAQTIHNLRLKLDLTQQAFGSLLGISFVTINRWENGHSSPTGLGAVLIELLSEALNYNSPSDVVCRLRAIDPKPANILRELLALGQRS